MFAKPTGRRKLTLSEWVNLAAATGTMLSAAFALMSVMAANSQVKSTLDAVNRAERYKALSVYFEAAYAVCKAHVAEKLQDYIAPRTWETYEKVAGENAYLITGINDPDLQVDKTDHESTITNTVRASRRLAEISRTLIIWIDDVEKRRELYKFSGTLWGLHGLRSIEKTKDLRERMAVRYGICKELVDRKIEDLTK
ncbi:hypothetical protein OKC48_20850 [Methylorubrum extorquens]|uniref:hypothetical protein n=1 Tax=Methylorubrum extorquens TaxID=408 RepID=UPI00223870F0|nr:hypothetical protein [Methylorubrum extorquens]UYW25697.1 hypothetical protein OKC48_20850 [Methylorubrum extorquens]